MLWQLQMRVLQHLKYTPMVQEKEGGHEVQPKGLSKNEAFFERALLASIEGFKITPVLDFIYREPR